MSDKIRSWLFIISTIVIIGMIGFLAFKVLLFLLPVIFVLYIIFKVKEYIERKNEKSGKNSYTSEYKASYNSERVGRVDDSIVEVIDVDYEDVNK